MFGLGLMESFVNAAVGFSGLAVGSSILGTFMRAGGLDGGQKNKPQGLIPTL